MMARIWPFKLRLPGGQIPPEFRIAGGIVDRGRPVPFRYGGRGYLGFAGDTLASALLAHGVEAPETVTLLRAEERPVATRPITQELYDDLAARERTNGHFRRFLPGRAPSSESDADGEIEHVYDHADCLIVGSGYSGLNTALERAEAGADVILIERDFEFGGSLLHDDQWIDGLSPADWRQRALDRLAVLSNVRMLSRTTARRWDGENNLYAEERPQGHLTRRNPYLPDRRLRHIQAREIVFALGGEDQIFSFSNNLLQGIFNVKTTLALVNRYAVLPGHRIVLYVGHTDGYRLAASLLARGIKPAAIIDARKSVPAACHHFARQAGIPLYPHHRVARAVGFRHIRGVVLHKSGEDPLNREIHLDCDCLVQSAGVFPRNIPESIEGEDAINSETEALSQIRRGPLFEAQKRSGAEHRTLQGWQLAAAYPTKGESLKSAREREARAAWTGVAMADLSHLAKLDLQGPDAAGLLARAFGERTEMAPGQLRPALLTEAGGIVRASVVGWCLAPSHFLLTMAAYELEIVRKRLTALIEASERPLRVSLTELTDGWGGIALMGPKAEALLAASLPLSVMGETLSHMSFREFIQDELPVRVARINLAVGTGFEIYTPAGYADILWNLLLEKGKAHGLTLAGTAARETLRIEAGRPGPREMNGTTTAADLGLAPPERLEGRHRARQQLVGLKSVSHEVEGKPAPPLRVGMTLYEGDGTEASGPGIGEVTSACYSPAHEREIALALLSDGRAREGTLIRAATKDGGKVIDVKVQAARVLPRQEISHG